MLSDTVVRNAKAREKPYKLSDGRGLYMLVNPSGSRWWRFKYLRNGKERGISFGVYPDVSLALARKRREEARTLLAEGGDPSEKRKPKKSPARTVSAPSRRSGSGSKKASSRPSP
jgi:hypothetical protein